MKYINSIFLLLTITILIPNLAGISTTVQADNIIGVSLPCRFKQSDIDLINQGRGHHKPSQAHYIDNRGKAIDVGANGNMSSSGSDINLMTGGYNYPQMSCYGTDVLASISGSVRWEWKNDGGNVLWIDGANGISVRHLHLAHLREAPFQNDGTYIVAGTRVATIGNTGSASDGTHLHFEVWKSGVQQTYDSKTDVTNLADQWKFIPLMQSKVITPTSELPYLTQSIDIQIETVSGTGVKYRYEIATGPNNFGSAIVSTQYDTGSTATFDASHGGDYYIRSRYLLPDGKESDWSQTVHFVISHPEIVTGVHKVNGTDIAMYQTRRTNLTFASTVKQRGTTNGNFDGAAWSDIPNLEAKSNVTMTSFDNKLYQAVIDADSVMKSRYWDGSTWSAWVSEPEQYTDGTTLTGIAGDVEMFIYQNRLHQIIRFGNGNIKMRSSADGIFDQESDETWINQQAAAGGDISSVVYEGDGKLYQTMRGNGGPSSQKEIYIRYSDDGDFTNFASDTGESWEYAGLATGGDITMYSFRNKLYQVIRGQGVEGDIYSRYTTDGIFNFNDSSQSTEQWYKENGGTFSDLSVAVFQNRLYQFLSGRDNVGEIYTRSSADGFFDSKNKGALTDQEVKDVENENWTLQNSGIAASDIYMHQFNNKLYQFVRGGDNKIYARSASTERFNDLSAAAQDWHQIESNFNAVGNIAITTFDNKIYLATKDPEGFVQTAAINPDTFAISVAWYRSGKGINDVAMIAYKGKLFQAITADGGLWTRSTTDGNFSDNSSSSEGWIYEYQSKITVNFYIYKDGQSDSRLMQAVTATNGEAAIRSTTDGIAWGAWAQNRASYSNIAFTDDGVNIYQTVVDTANGNVATRKGYSTSQPNTSPAAGFYWANWEQSGITIAQTRIFSYAGQIYQSALGGDFKDWTRQTSTINQSWNAWVEGSSSNSNISFIKYNNKLCLAKRSLETTSRNIHMKCTADGKFDGMKNEVPILDDSGEIWDN